MSSKNCQFCEKVISKENIREHLESDCDYVQVENSVMKCRLCEEVIKSNHKSDKRHVNSCKHFFKFVKKCSSGFECRLCSDSTACFISRGTMNRHLRLKHGILQTDPIKSNNTVLGDVENNTGYSFFHRVCIDFEFHLLFFQARHHETQEVIIQVVIMILHQSHPPGKISRKFIQILFSK